MAIPLISICYNFLILLFLVSLLGHLSKSQIQTTPTVDKIHNCSIFRESCVSFSDCPNAVQIIRNKEAKYCGFTNDKPKPIVKLCCNITTTTTTTGTPPSLQNTPAIGVNETTSSKNATDIALEKCREFRKFRYVKTWLPPIIPGEEGVHYYEVVCVKYSEFIIGQAPVEPMEYPHMALIGYGNKFSDVEWSCGGSLISERFIISAAHCGKTSVLGPPKWALLGDPDSTLSKNTDARSATYSIINIYDHPQYVRSAQYYDISLFELNTTVKINQWMRPACLHTSMAELTEGFTTITTGWEKTDTSNRDPINGRLFKKPLQIVSDKTCEMSYNVTNNLKFIRGFDSSSMICATESEYEGYKCTGDSGDPLQIKVPNEICMWNIVGITSLRSNVCVNGPDPGVYTRVAYYLDWIQSIVWP